MAATIIIRDIHSRAGVKIQPSQATGLEDRDDELQAAIRDAGLKTVKQSRDSHLVDGPVHISHDTLMGKMPKSDKVLKKGEMLKLTSSYDWKPVTVALTTVGLFLSRVGEDVLRDLIPLYEVIEVKKRSDMPGEIADHQKHETGKPKEAKSKQAHVSSHSHRISFVEGSQDTVKSLHIIQIRTIEGGYNSGRTYYFNAESDEVCSDWIGWLRSESDRATILKLAGPNIFRRMRYRLCQIYESFLVQSAVAVLIFASFLVNIIQTEMLGSQPAEASPPFSAMEYFFTAAFTAELVFNFLAHCYKPFFKVAPSPLPHPPPPPPSLRLPRA